MSNVGRHLRPRLIALSVAACFGVSAQQGLANPTGSTVVSGGASFASAGNTLTVTNTANAIINWQSFSIGVNEITRFLQSSASSAVLNRVVGAGGVIPQSVIDGILSSNGRVFLLNSSGIVFGANARIDVAGLVASSLNLSDQDFLNGRMHFAEVPGAGSVSNAGVIQAASGGRVFLIAPNVENSGAISAPQGQIVLAAGKSVDLVSENSPFVTVRVTADSEQALNLGSLIADSGRIDMSGALVRSSGTIAANSAVLGANGEIRLVATNSVTLDAGSVTSASGGAQGGNIQVSAPVVVQVGNIRADGDAGGKIQIDASNFLQAGIVSASGSAGAGGAIGVNAPHVIQTAAALMAADGNGGDGGSISVDASGALDGLLFSSASYSATGDKGGNIKLLGHDIVLLGASADASGANSGGTILVGGDFQGNNPAVSNAITTGINFSTTLKADATQTGDGGKIVVWSDTNTQFYGTASARGGAQSGNGGFMEISGKESLTMGGFADAGAPNGTAGSLLLDPKNIIIDSNTGGSGTLGSFQLVDPHPGANELFGSQVVVLPSQNVVVTDPNDSFTAISAGAVYLFNSNTGQLISTLFGSAANDRVGSDPIVQLSTGNYLITSPNWAIGGGVAGTGVGAVTWSSGTLGVSGAVSAANSLVGSTPGDGAFIVVHPLTNGNVAVRMPLWDRATIVDAGAVTWMNGATGQLADGTAGGAVSASNSLVGSATGDRIGSASNGITALSNGNYVVSSPAWGSNSTTAFGGPGAMTWVNGATGRTANGGAFGVSVSAANSLVGSSPTDFVGSWSITELPVNGNLVFVNNNWNGSAGASTWMNGATGALKTGAFGGVISSANSLVGTAAFEQAGSHVTALTNGNYLLTDFNFGGGLGAVVFGLGASGVAGTISTANSLVGSLTTDNVGLGALSSVGIQTLANGNYLVRSPQWNNNAGAVTFGNGITGTLGPVSASNSLIGSTGGTPISGLPDRVGFNPVTLLTGGSNYVVTTPAWTRPAGAAAAVAHVGAVTWGNGSTGTVGPISAANSLTGSQASDQVGSGGVLPLITNGNYVVMSPNWNNGPVLLAGAVTWVNGTTGIIGGSTSPGGAVSPSNSLVGTTANDSVGSGFVMPLFNGNYVVASPHWDGPGFAAPGPADVGAVTFGNGTTGVFGPVSATNSLVGTTANDAVGSGFVMPLFNSGNYVVISPNWNNGPVLLAGAVTWVNGTNGNIAGSTSPGGTVSASNSLVGTTANDQVGSGGVTPLFINGNYVVSSPNWNSGRGAVTFGNGTTGIIGLVSSSNSLVGSTPDTLPGDGDRVGSSGIIELFNGTNDNYLVLSPQWHNGAATSAGAVTWVNGTNGHAFGEALPGAVLSASNSLVGSTTNDAVGAFGVTRLINGNYVVESPNWNSGRGAVTFGSGTAGIAGPVSLSNSLVGSTPDTNFTGDHVGSSGIIELFNGTNDNYLALSPQWNNGAATRAGAVTWVNGTNGHAFGETSPGAILSVSNSLVGGTSNDQVGSTGISCECSNFFPLPDGNFVLRTSNWTNPITNAPRAGAVTFGSITTGIAGLVSSSNSIVGISPNDNIGSGGIFPLTNGDFVVSSPNAANGALLSAGLVHVVTPGTGGTVTAPATGQTFASNPSGDVTITPAAITAITNTGTAVVLQANNDITLNPGSDIVTSTSGPGGALTLQAGRSILLNSSIITDNGNLTLIANDTLASGVVTANRDAGAALIAMAAGTLLDAGSGAISITLADGAGRTGAQTSGNISLASVATTGSLSVRNNGLILGSNVLASGSLKAASVTLSAATGALGSSTAPLEIAATGLNANASSGIYLNTNSASPAMVTVNTLTNVSTGDIVMNAHGGATFTSLVTNPGGNVSITTFSPLDVNAGISAGNSIFLTTSGTPGTNNMSLNGPYTYGTNGTFAVTIGPLGQLTLFGSTPPLVLTSALFPNPPNITNFTFVPSEPDPAFLQTSINSINQSTKFDSDNGLGESGKKDKDSEKKGVAVCK